MFTASLHILFRLFLTLALALSLAMTLWSASQIARNPLLAPVVARTADEIAAAADRALARDATPARLGRLIAQRLDEEPRNWVALTALRDLAEERDVALPPSVAAAYAAAWETDTGYLARAGECAACAWDPAACTLSNVLICQAPVALTPIGDLGGIGRAGLAYATGEPVDEIDLALSVVGLGATALIVASGGSSATVKLGAATARLARRMGLVSPRLTALVGDAARRGIDWAALPAARSADDLAAAVRAEVFAPLTAIAADLGQVSNRIGPAATLHLVALVDDAPDARRLSGLAAALGPRTVGTAEVLGKARLFRLGVRFSDLALTLVAGVIGLAASLAGLLAGMIQSRMLRRLRRTAAAGR